ncbi:hypothetical protein [Burkholderia sp. BCC0419]|uniref:hypothetical protein n=1 Tax=Burkholderia sp. BCC0419 TaxID=486878 RepID=UPI00158D9C4A|nr:hypothetical protein [Burkholderia sp. BCC0419]
MFDDTILVDFAKQQPDELRVGGLPRVSVGKAHFGAMFVTRKIIRVSLVKTGEYPA